MREVTGCREPNARRRASAASITPRARAWGLILVALIAFLSLAGSAQAAPNTTVSFTFDDGRPSQLAAAQELANRGMKGTFFIISAEIGRPGVMTVGDLNTLEGERHGDRRAHGQPPRPADAHERRGDARALPQPQLADGPRLRRLRHGLPARLDQRERQAAGRGLRLQQRPCRKRALVRRRRRLRRDRAAARRLPAAHAERLQQLDDARADEGGGHERREQRRRLGAARAPRRLQRPERSAAPAPARRATRRT